MKAEQKLQWIAALLSGDYRQGKGRLRTPHDTYCCLGVECDVAAQQGMGEWTNTAGVDEQPRWQFVVTNTEPMPMIAPTWHVMSWSSIPLDLLPKIGILDGVGKAQAILQDLNDKGGKSFEQIAEWIEENVPVDEDTEEVTP